MVEARVKKNKHQEDMAEVETKKKAGVRCGGSLVYLKLKEEQEVMEVVGEKCHDRVQEVDQCMDEKKGEDQNGD